MPDHSTMKLGAKPARHDLRRMARATIGLSKLPAPPGLVDWTDGITDWGMMLNSTLGDCTIAGVAHAIQIATQQTTGLVTPSDDVVLKGYEAWAGYNPQDPWTDQGAVEADILACWERDGFSDYKLVAHAEPNPQIIDHVKQSIAHFGALYIGVDLPLSAQSQTVWDVADDADGGAPRSWGGHCVVVPKYDADGLTCITWGQLKRMTWNFWLKYVSEAHCLLIDQWMKRYPASKAGDLIAMMQDAAI